ncbi:MAG: hypothetical protein ACRDL5_04125 [Solirubrobacteraceae bacterium]
MATIGLDALKITGTLQGGMTAKEKLLERVGAFSEEEAVETLRLLDHRADPVAEAFRDAPLDDEPWTDEDEAAAAEGRSDIAAGRTVSLEEAMRELG